MIPIDDAKTETTASAPLKALSLTRRLRSDPAPAANAMRSRIPLATVIWPSVSNIERSVPTVATYSSQARPSETRSRRK